MNIFAIMERPAGDGGYGVANGNARQAGAARECVVADGGDRVGDGQ